MQDSYLLEKEDFKVLFEKGRIAEIRLIKDEFETNFAGSQNGWHTGDVLLRWEKEGKQEYIRTEELTCTACESENGLTACYDAKGIGVKVKYTLLDQQLYMDIEAENKTGETIRLHDTAFAWCFNTNYVKDTLETYQRRVVRHSYISGHGSFAYCCRPNGEGPFLLLTPCQGTSLEYYPREEPGDKGDGRVYFVFAHAESARKEVPGDWNLPVTGKTLEAGEKESYHFKFQWVKGHKEAREALDVSVQTVPGYTIPRGLTAKMAVSCKMGAVKLSCNREDIVITKLPDHNQTEMYSLQFSGVGEYPVKIDYGDGRWTTAEFFATLPLEELLKLRGKHLTEHQRYTGDKWYNGLISSWHMGNKRMTTPEDRMGLYLYAVAADDPGLCKVPFLAQKNVYKPDDGEIAAIEYYIEHFVWGGLQRKDTEVPHPYGIYGSDTWIDNRNSNTGYGCGGVGQERMWRTFDYTHIIMLYFCMYRIAKRYPEKTKYLDADGYLSRAYHTAMAFYEVPYNIFMKEPWAFYGWTDWAYKQGNFHELYIPRLIDSLEEEGQKGPAADLRLRWENKCKYMLFDHPYPYASEMYFDSTAFESTEAVARYAATHTLKADQGDFYDKNKLGPDQGAYTHHEQATEEKVADFTRRQMQANMACHNSVAPSYYLMGSDIRGGGNTSYLLSYMTHMGGWAILEHALYTAENPEDYLRLGYACYLAPWCLINTGKDYPWWGCEENKGAAGWAFNPTYGTIWGMADIPRGIWPFDGEIDSGFSGGMRMSCSVLAKDSLFGLTAYGASCEEKDDEIVIKPMDALRVAFHDVRSAPEKLHMRLNRDAIKEIHLPKDGKTMTVIVENITADDHETQADLCGMINPGHITVFMHKENVFESVCVQLKKD